MNLFGAQQKQIETAARQMLATGAEMIKVGRLGLVLVKNGTSEYQKRLGEEASQKAMPLSACTVDDQPFTLFLS